MHSSLPGLRQCWEPFCSSSLPVDQWSVHGYIEEYSITTFSLTMSVTRIYCIITLTGVLALLQDQRQEDTAPDYEMKDPLADPANTDIMMASQAERKSITTNYSGKSIMLYKILVAHLKSTFSVMYPIISYSKPTMPFCYIVLF